MFNFLDFSLVFKMAVVKKTKVLRQLTTKGFIYVAALHVNALLAPMLQFVALACIKDDPKYNVERIELSKHIKISMAMLFIIIFRFMEVV